MASRALPALQLIGSSDHLSMFSKCKPGLWLFAPETTQEPAHCWSIPGHTRTKTARIRGFLRIGLTVHGSLHPSCICEGCIAHHRVRKCRQDPDQETAQALLKEEHKSMHYFTVSSSDFGSKHNRRIRQTATNHRFFAFLKTHHPRKMLPGKPAKMNEFN